MKSISEIPRPRVSDILALVHSYDGVDPRILHIAAQRGTMVHRMIHLLNLGQLDEALVPDEITPYINAWRGFQATYEPRSIAGEIWFINDERDRGHLPYRSEGIDLVLEMDGKYWVVDLKSVSVMTAKLKRVYMLQLAAYAQALMDRAVDVDIPTLHHAGIVHLRKDGTFMLYDMTDDVMGEGIDFFNRLLKAWYTVHSF